MKHQHLLSCLFLVACATPPAANCPEPAAPAETTAPATQAAAASTATATAYTWKSVPIIGGGFVDGFVFHPTAKDVLYARTDMGGAYRRNPQTRLWEPLLDWVPYEDLNLMGVESIALDPADPNKLFLACGTYTADDVPNGAILRSTDQGRTFQRSDVPFKFGGNEAGRGNGERMAVDPNAGNVLFLGTRKSGLWRSTDGAVTWTQVTTFPQGVFELSAKEAALPAWQGGGHNTIVFVVFDPKSGGNGKPSQTLFVGVSVMGKPGLFRSDDGGVTWKTIPKQPTAYRPNHGTLASDGNLFVSFGTDPGPMPMVDGGVWKLNTTSGKWTDITPDKPSKKRKFGYGAVAVDAQDPNVVVATSFYRPKGEEVFRSTNGGKTWKRVFESGGVMDYSLAPYVKDTPLHWLFDVEINPTNPNHAMFTTGYGGWESFDLTELDKGRPTHWQVMSPGIEETVALALYSPAQGAHVVTAIGDYSGFVHWSLDEPAEGNPKPPFLGNTHDVSGGELNSNVMVRVGRPRNEEAPIGHSIDAGKTWKVPASLPEPKASAGHIAVSADGGTWIWTPEGMVPYVTSDQGATWTQAEGLRKDMRVVADRVNPKSFYAIALSDGLLFKSTDGGKHFTTRNLELPGAPPARAGSGKDNRTNRGDNRGGQDRIYATPGKAGDLWLAAYDGLFHAPTSQPFERKPGVEQIHGFGFGKAAPGADTPALYLIGIVEGQRGFFRSTDGGATWLRINDDAHQWGLVLHITGDPKKFGRVYVGTHGRGTFYGDPSAEPASP